MSENKSPLLSSESPWKNNANNIWLGSTVTLHRNIDKFNFPLKLSVDKRRQIISLINKELMNLSELKNPKLLRAEELSSLDKEFFVEHFLTSQSFQQAHVGEGFVLDESSSFLATINEKDHLILEWVDCREELEESWERLVKIESALNTEISFAFSPRFGFLTSDPRLCGTGLVVRVFLHLPALIYSNHLEEAVKKYQDEGVEQSGIQGDPKNTVGDIVSFRNNFTLGLTEENILSSLRNLSTKLLVEEKSARSHLKQEEPSYMKDKVSRAYAILMHSYQIEATEALEAISLLKLGLDMNWLSQVTHASLNELFFNCRRAHLLCQKVSEATKPEEIPHKRSEFIHKALTGAILLI